MLTARATLLSQVSGGSKVAAAQMLAVFSSGVGVAEFLLNPVMGRLSDLYGRKVFLMQSPAVSILMKVMVFLHPR